MFLTSKHCSEWFLLFLQLCLKVELQICHLTVQLLPFQVGGVQFDHLSGLDAFCLFIHSCLSCKNQNKLHQIQIRQILAPLPKCVFKQSFGNRRLWTSQKQFSNSIYQLGQVGWLKSEIQPLKLKGRSEYPPTLLDQFSFCKGFLLYNLIQLNLMNATTSNDHELQFIAKIVII